MMTRAAAVASLLFSLSAVAHAEGEAEAPVTTTANTLVVVTPNAPVVVTNGQVATQPAAAPAIMPPGAAEMPPVPTPPAGAPHNEDWNNVSHINGQVVPVGERGSYLYSFKKTNLATNPLGWMFGYYQLAASHAVSQNIAISVEVSGWSTDHGNHSGYQIAATAPIYFRRTYSGPFLEAGLVIHNDNEPTYALDCYSCGPTSSTNTWTGPEVMLGWSWIFDSGLNMSFAFGAAKKMSSSDSMSSYSSDEPQPAGYFRVGYAF